MTATAQSQLSAAFETFRHAYFRFNKKSKERKDQQTRCLVKFLIHTKDVERHSLPLRVPKSRTQV